MFILSKVLSFFLNPFIWITILLIISILSADQRRRKKLIIISLSITLFFSNPLLINLILIQFQADPMPMKSEEQYEVGVVLGGMVSFDEVNSTPHFNQSSDRFIQTALLYKTGHIKKIIASGGNAIFVKQHFAEAEFIAKNLIDLEIPKEDIYIETQSKNTKENAKYTHKLIDSLGGIKGKLVLITSAFHIPRATEVFEKEGLKVRPYPCAFGMLPSASKLDADAFIPTSDSFEGWARFFKEIIGRIINSVANR